MLTVELMLDCIEHQPNDKLAVKVENGLFFWAKLEEKPEHKTIDSMMHRAINESKSSETLVLESTVEVAEEYFTPILKGINLKVEKGSFVSIVGDVGCGKSSLVQALVGEMIYLEG